MKKNYDLPLLLHTSREASETEEKQWFSQYSKTGQCKTPQESTQLCADWHKASQTNGNVWVREVQGRDHPSTGRTCISSSIFQLSTPPPCVLKRLSAYGANYKHFKEKQNSKMKGHFPLALHFYRKHLHLSPYFCLWCERLRCHLDKTPYP